MKSHFEWGDSLASLTSEMAVLGVVIPFAQMVEAQKVTTLTTRRLETSVGGGIGSSTLSKN